MIHRRTRDRGSIYWLNPEMLIVLVILGILVPLFIVNVLHRLDSKGPTCIGHLARLRDQPLPKETVCPKCDKPYAITLRADQELIVCPASESHLESNPEFVRSKGGAWRLKQTLTPYAGGGIEFSVGRSEVRESPGRMSIHILPGRPYRYVIGPLVFAVLASLSLIFLYHSLLAIPGRDRGGFFLSLGFAVSLGLGGYSILVSIASSSELVLERSGARVTRIGYRFGSKVSEKTYAGSLGFIPVTGMYPWPTKLLLVHAPDAADNGVTEVDGIPRNRLDVVERLNQVLVGP